MREMFTDLYKKVVGFFQPQQEKENLKEVACNRLKLVLMQDRTNLTPHLLERMREELIDLLSKYVEMDKDALELNFAQEGDSMALMLSIPVLRAKDEEEIQAFIKAEEEEKAKVEAEETEESEEISQEEVEEINEDIAEETEGDVCSCDLEGDEEISASPNEVEEEIEEISKKSKKKG